MILRMKKIYQTKFAVPQKEGGTDPDDIPDEEKGNCFAACIASLLETDLEDIPTLQGEGWSQRALWYIEQQGMISVVDSPNHLNGPEWLDAGMYADQKCYLWEGPLDGLHIAIGKSPRGDWNHAVIMNDDGELIHDPRPEGGGIEGDPLEKWYLLERPES